mmetsp:Transcript_37735/g.70199  ORF Transcript_37735/g.70199 Transcript_37735/m.70199 type:complete len:210 (+) Transcript_37735:186-815(+)
MDVWHAPSLTRFINKRGPTGSFTHSSENLSRTGLSSHVSVFEDIELCPRVIRNSGPRGAANLAATHGAPPPLKTDHQIAPRVCLMTKCFKKHQITKSAIDQLRYEDHVRRKHHPGHEPPQEPHEARVKDCTQDRRIGGPPLNYLVWLRERIYEHNCQCIQSAPHGPAPMCTVRLDISTNEITEDTDSIVDRSHAQECNRHQRCNEARRL